MRLPTRVAGIIIKDNKILLIRRIKDNEKYWVFPGGGLENTDNSPEDGLLREVQEETSVAVNINKLVYTHEYDTSNGLYYLCEFVSGEPRLGESIEKQRMLEGKQDIYEPIWVNLSEISGLMIYPLEIRDWLISDHRNNFVNTPRVQKIDSKDLRKA